MLRTDYYEFMNPVRIVSGYKAVDNLPYELSQLGVSRPLLITDAGVIQAGLLKIVQAAFDETPVCIAAVFDQTPPDSSKEIVKHVAAIYRNHNCDAFIALGGGSEECLLHHLNLHIKETGSRLSRTPFHPVPHDGIIGPLPFHPDDRLSQGPGPRPPIPPMARPGNR